MRDLTGLGAFMAVARAGGFREAAKASRLSASALSDGVRRIESELGVRLLNRTTRSVTPTEAGRLLMERLGPALDEVHSALDLVNDLRDRPIGMLRLNVPVSAAKLVLPAIVPGFLAAYPEIRLEIVADDSFVDLVASGCDAGIRYDERLEQDMIAVPIGPREQSFATVAAPAHLDRCGRPEHPRDLLRHNCVLGRFASGRLTAPWEFERDGEVVVIEPTGSLIVRVAGGMDLAIESVVAGVGVIHLFEDWARPYLESGALEAVLPEWWQRFSGPFLYYPGRRLVPAPLRAFIDYVKAIDRHNSTL